MGDRLRGSCGVLRVFLCLLAPALGSARVRADGGTLQFSERRGGYQISVFTTPSPCRAGPVDVSVFVQDAGSSEPLSDVDVRIVVSRPGQPDRAVGYPATRQAATNKLLQAVVVDIPAAGSWQMAVCVQGRHGSVQTAFPIEAAEPLPPWAELWFWISLPILPILLFSIHQLARRSAGRTA